MDETVLCVSMGWCRRVKYELMCGFGNDVGLFGCPQRRASIASNKSGAISRLGVFTAHLTPGAPTEAVSSIKNGIPRGPLADIYKISLFAFLRFATKKTLVAAKFSTVESMLWIMALDRSFATSLESGRDFHVIKESFKSKRINRSADSCPSLHLRPTSIPIHIRGLPKRLRRAAVNWRSFPREAVAWRSHP
ncbi:hypothetical protein IEQ34_021774 [Dendrobium chrysotoxum]|uniref:Uncharacterized protein n=1 Tax=Dendrobium chrysotoxum TaxID=161865 RepID=A0AAV7G6G9_DENCH|nr:hypothetical protein IEQ34_021774 [Dendrobium chrysotoxum]